jgi:Skp family chaperone for outer membrane proteins
MPIATHALIQGARLRFVGPAANRDPEFLVVPADGKSGPVCVVIRVTRSTVIMHPEESPEKHFHAETQSGRLFRFIVVNELQERLDRDWKRIEDELKDADAGLRERTQQFNERQMSKDDKADRAQRIAAAQRMMEFKQKLAQKEAKEKGEQDS